MKTQRRMKGWQILVASALIMAVAGPSAVRAEQPVVIERHTTIVEGPDVDVDVGGGGVVSSTVDVAGDVLALPFKLVGGMIDLVF